MNWPHPIRRQPPPPQHITADLALGAAAGAVAAVTFAGAIWVIGEAIERRRRR